jgi:Domain of unknown function (DUF4279)
MSKDIGHFSLWGDFEVEEITYLLGMQPSWVMRKGEVLEGASSQGTVSTWDIHCPPDCESMQEQLNSLLDVLSPKADVLKPLASKFHADLNLAGSCDGSSTVFSIDREMLQKIAALNLTLNCFYICDGDTNGH